MMVGVVTAFRLYVIYIVLCEAWSQGSVATALNKNNVKKAVDINEKLFETNTHIYFLVGPGSDKFRSVQSFISDMGFHSRHYDIIIAFDRNVIAKFQGRVLRYLTMSRKMITRQWVRRYITKVDDPASRMKNLGRLALAMTVDKVFQVFLDSSFSNCLLFEDDVMINPEIGSKAPMLFSDMLSLPSTSWHMQYLGFCFECGERKNYELVAPSPLFAEAIFPLCTHAILFNRATVFVIMNTYKPFSSNKGDWMFHTTACEHGLTVIRPHRSIFVQNVSTTTIGESQLGNYNDKRDFASWVKCRKEQHACRLLHKNYTSRNNGYKVESSPLSHMLSYPRGIPVDYVL